MCLPESQAEEAFASLNMLIQELGLSLNKSKLVSPSDCMICMGIEVSAIKKTLRILNEKLLEITSFIEQLRCGYLTASTVDIRRYQ